MAKGKKSNGKEITGTVTVLDAPLYTFDGDHLWTAAERAELRKSIQGADQAEMRAADTKKRDLPRFCAALLQCADADFAAEKVQATKAAGFQSNTLAYYASIADVRTLGEDVRIAAIRCLAMGKLMPTHLHRIKEFVAIVAAAKALPGAVVPQLTEEMIAGIADVAKANQGKVPQHFWTGAPAPTENGEGGEKKDTGRGKEETRGSRNSELSELVSALDDTGAQLVEHDPSGDRDMKPSERQVFRDAVLERVLEFFPTPKN